KGSLTVLIGDSLTIDRRSANTRATNSGGGTPRSGPLKGDDLFDAVSLDHLINGILASDEDESLAQVVSVSPGGEVLLSDLRRVTLSKGNLALGVLSGRLSLLIQLSLSGLNLGGDLIPHRPECGDLLVLRSVNEV